MEYFESELIFEPALPPKRKAPKEYTPEAFQESVHEQGYEAHTELLGIKVRVGNKPLVVNLKQFAKPIGVVKGHGSYNKDYYLIIHSISAIRTKGKAKVDELHYYAESDSKSQLQTIDLIPGTRFQEVFKAGLNYEVALSLTGEALIDVPAEFSDSSVLDMMNIGGGIRLQTTADLSLAGKLMYSIQFPVVQSAGIASNTCAWVLAPDEINTPLLGDQLLIQSVAVPANTKSISYKLQGKVKVDKGIFWKHREKETPVYKVEVEL